MKKLIIISLALLALLTSCNLDNQGIFAEVIDRTPSDNRKLSVIGLSSDNKTLYFSSVNGIEAYDLITPKQTEKERYKTLDDSENARKISISLMVDGKIVYGVTRATQDIVEYTGFYLCDPDAKATKKLSLTGAKPALTGSWDKYAHDSNGNVYEAVLSGLNLSFNKKCSAPEQDAKRFVTRMDNIFVFTSDAYSEKPETSTLLYYLFDGSALMPITGLSNPGKIRSVAKDTDSSIIAVFSSDNASTVYKITGTSAEILKGTAVGSKISKNFASFIYDGYLYYTFDKSSTVYRMELATGNTSTDTISKISNVSIVGYYSYAEGEYRICTSNNGFFKLKINSDHSVTIN